MYLGLTNIGVTTELILKTQWSLGQITPFIGSKSFDALKLWTTIKYFGQEGIERLIDAHLALTKRIQGLINANPDLILLNKTDINACIYMYMPRELQRQKTRLATPEMDQLNDVNKAIKMEIMDDGKFFVHGFPLRRVPHPLLPEDHSVFVLRILNGNPLSTIESVWVALAEVLQIGKRLVREREEKLSSSAKL